MRPPCYNRQPRAAGRWHQVGRRPDGRPVLRWFPRWYVDRCATWDGVGIGKDGQRYPVAHKFDCRGCSWLPDEHRSMAGLIGVTELRLDWDCDDINPFEALAKDLERVSYRSAWVAFRAEYEAALRDAVGWAHNRASPNTGLSEDAAMR
ncbi:MAG TPA: hypothetical protein VGE09_11330 [Pseudoxanthomonas sp.]